MKKNVFVITIAAGVMALAILATYISDFARRGELKVHLRGEILEARKQHHLLPLKSHRALRQVCEDILELLVLQEREGDDLEKLKSEVPERLKKRDFPVGYYHVTFGNMPLHRDYINAPEELLEAAIHAQLSHKGFARRDTDSRTRYCFLLAERSDSY